MTYCDAWISDPSDVPGLDWKGISTLVNAPIRCSPMFPEGHAAHFAIRKGIESGRLRGEQVDPLVWAAVMTKQEIVALLTEIFGPPGQYERRHDSGLRHLADRMRELRAFVNGLPADGVFAAVTDEF